MARPPRLQVCPTSTRENAHVSPPLRLVWPAVPGGAGALSFSLLACSEPRFQVAPVQTQPAFPVKPISRQQPQYLPLPAEAQLRRDPRLGTITPLKAPDRSAQLEQNPAFARLQAGGRFGDMARAFIAACQAGFRLTNPADALRVQEGRLLVGYQPPHFRPG